MENQRETSFMVTKKENKANRKYSLIIILKYEGIETDSTSQTSMAEAKKNQHRMIKK